MKIIDYLKSEYEKKKEEYSTNKNLLTKKYNDVLSEFERDKERYKIETKFVPEFTLDRDMENIYINKYQNRDRDSYYISDYCGFPKAETSIYSVEKYNWQLHKLNEIRELLIQIKEIIENKPQHISIKKENLPTFEKYKNIKFVDKLGDYKSSSQYKSSLSGEMSGSSFLGCGSINGYVEGSSSGSSKASYDDCVLIEYTYDLDYEIEDYMLDTMSVESVILALKGQ